ncbi:MAG: hypothetical protein JSS30_06200 [Verrucomicrobia bacterium]|nr:hypothetical protein [Verrucomicrobiota bacterium]
MPSVTPPGRPEPQQPPPSTGPLKPETPAQSAYDAELLNSPFAKMFAKTGAMPTAKEMQAIINNLLKSVIDEIKRQDAEAKKAYEKLKKVIEGTDDD